MRLPGGVIPRQCLLMDSADLAPGEDAIHTVVPDRAEEYAGHSSHIPGNSPLYEHTGESDVDDGANHQSRQMASGVADLDSINQFQFRLRHGL